MSSNERSVKDSVVIGNIKMGDHVEYRIKQESKPKFENNSKQSGRNSLTDWLIAAGTIMAAIASIYAMLAK